MVRRGSGSIPDRIVTSDRATAESWRSGDMASENKKRKAKNSYLLKGNEGAKIRKGKRIAYFAKWQRVENKKSAVEGQDCRQSSERNSKVEGRY